MQLLNGFEETMGSPVLMLTGMYESMFHDALERAIARAPEAVVNVGCADGYYAVGLALRLPEAHVRAHDLASSARRETAALARLNQVTDRVTVAGRCRSFPADTDLVLCDIEGGEVELLHPHGLERAIVLLETHDFARPGAATTMRDRFAATHEVETLEGAPNPGDTRSGEQHWLAMWPR
jgi:hypothetical protein